jgi:regulator of sirC expression with transglutaminase-like and TPR domain
VDRSSRWRQIVAGPEEQIPLDEATLLIAAEANTDLDVSAQLVRLDDVATRLGSTDTDRLCQFVFQTLGVRGDEKTYDDPRNSYLDQVLDRRLGIPISLSVLLMEIGRRCGVPLEGVGMPGHFLVRDPTRPDLLIDAFSGGTLLDRAACGRLLETVAGAEVQLQPGFLAPVGARAILLRMLTNLDHSFRRRSDEHGVRWVSRLRCAIPGQSVADRMALADTLARLGDVEEAAALFEELAREPQTTPSVAQDLQTRARGLLAPYN